jgi:hypothetical protein
MRLSRHYHPFTVTTEAAPPVAVFDGWAFALMGAETFPSLGLAESHPFAESAKGWATRQLGLRMYPQTYVHFGLCKTFLKEYFDNSACSYSGAYSFF